MQATGDYFPLTNNIVFAKVLSNKELCKEFLETLLHFRIERLEDVQSEAAVKADPFSKGVRFDVYIKDADTVYDIEMQMLDTQELPLRSRYYQSLCDIDMLKPGQFYTDLKQTYILFLCPFDLFGKRLPLYTFEYTAAEDNSVKLGDKTRKLFYNFKEYAKMQDEETQRLLEYLATGNASSAFTGKLDGYLHKLHGNENWRNEVMTLEMERIGWKKQGIAEGMLKGAHQKAVETARRMLEANLPVADIALYTGLPIEDVQKLAEMQTQ